MAFLSAGLASLLLRRRSSAAVPVGFLEEDLVDWILDTLGLVCYPGQIPQAVTLPALSFELVYGDRGYTLDGKRTSRETHLQITFASLDYYDCGRGFDRLETGLIAFRGWMGSTLISFVKLSDERTGYEVNRDGSDNGIHTKMAEFTFYYK